ncbi:MBG domain-containing protein [Stenotrophomonas sp. Iso1]|uniref:MBG domain-containing protein n=1 Tax=Stenotrophomonas sp. Iso1 TaxID=2977283 RepID=UPI0022B7BB94|nr:MBG domain-containing protein [Stenotrophomonas sp. Iso1]
MNRIYRLVFNHVLGVVQVAAEVCSTPRNGQHPTMRLPQRHVLLALTAALLLTGSLQATAQTLPQGQIIRSGSAIINVSGAVMTIDQASRASLIEWDSFNIGAANTVQFNLLQGSQATAINLVTGNSGSAISGQLTSNGQVFLINQAGITFNAGARVNVGGLLASTLLPGTPGLLDANGVSPTFQLAGGGTSAVVSNNGATLTALAGGISLIGGAVSNTGVISATNGNIDLVAAGAATVMNGVSSSGMSQLTFLPTAASTIAGTGVSNAGVLNARNIGMNALMGPGLSSVGINTGGTIIANAIDAGDGSLTIRSSSAIQMSGGNITARSVDLTATDAVGLAGDINADDIAIQAGSVMQTAGAVQGTLQLGTQGSVNLAQAGNRITTVGGTVGAGLTLTTDTDLANGAALSVGGTSTLSAGHAGARRNITLTNTGNSFGGLVNATGADLMLVGSGRLGLGTIDATTLVAQGGSIGLNGAVTTTGNQTYRSAVTLTGNSTLEGSAIAFDGTIDGSYRLDVASRGLSTFSSAVGSVSPLQGLSVDAGGGIQLAGNVNALGSIAFYGPLRLVGSRSLTSTTGNMELAGTVDGDGGALSLSARNLTFGGAVGGSGAVAGLLAQATTITVGNAITSSGTIMLDGDVQLAGNTRLTSTGSGVITTGGITSTRPNGYDLGLVTDGAIHVNGNLSAANVAIEGSQFSGQGITSRGNLDIRTTASLAQAGAYQVDGKTRISSDGDIVLRNAGNRFSGEVSLSAVNAELHAGNLTLGNSRLNGDLTLALSGGLGQSAGSMLEVGGATRIAAGTSIQLDNTDNQGRAVNRFGGPVSLSGGNSGIRGTGTLAFADLDVASVVAIADTVKLPVAGRSIGLQYYQGAIELAGDTVLDSQLGEINFQGSVDGGYALTIARARDVVFGGNVGSNRALASLDTRNGGPLRLSGNITADGAIMLGNLSLASATPQLFSVRSNSGSLQVGRIDGTSSGQTSLVLAAHGTLDLRGDAGTLAGAGLNNLQLSGATVNTKAIRTSGRLDIASTSGFAQNGVLNVGGNASFTAGSGGDLTLDTEPNTFGGTVALQGKQARIGAQSALALDGVDVAALDASSATSLSLADAHIAGRAGLDAASLLIDDARIDGALVASASAGDIRQGSGSLVIGSNSQLAASNDIVLGNAGNQLGSALQASGRDVVLTSATALDLQQLQATRDATLSGNGVRLGSLSAQGALSIDSSAAITQADALQVGGNSRFVATDDITLANAGNRFSGRVTLDGRNVAVTSADGLLLDTVRAKGNFGARAGSAGISQNAALQVDGRSDLISSGAITLGRKDNQFGDVVTIQGRTAEIATAGALSLGDITAGQLKADADGNLRLTGRILADDVALATQALFDNRAGADAIRLNGNGSWHIYLSSPTLAHTFGHLDSGNTAVWNTAAFAGTSAGGNRYLFAWQPTLTFVANTLRKTYGDTLALGNAFSVSGAMAGVLGAYKTDDPMALFTGTPEITSAGAAAGANVSGSPYQIDIRQGTLDTSASGYALAFATGQLAIDPRSLIISAGNGNKTYGQNGGLGGYNANGLVNGDTLTSVDLGSGGTSATANVGDYTITASNADGTGLSNYDITYVDGTLSIGKAGLTITAGNGNKTYGQNGGLGGYGVNGLLNNDNVSSVALGSNGSAATANVGDYTITASNADGSGLSNYDITYVDGTLSIGKAGLTITAGNGSKTYGQNGGLGGYSIDGLLNSDNVSSVALGSNGSAATANVGNYTITASNADGSGLSNYDITYVDGTLSIGKAGLTITAGNGNKTYGQNGGLGGYSIDGLLNNDAVSSVALSSNGTAATANVGDYTITASNADGTGLSNYDITYTDGVLSIGKAGLIISANNASRRIGQSSSFNGYTAEGLVNGDTIDDVRLFSDGSDLNAQPGGYAILASDAQGARLGNYDITYREGTLDVAGVSSRQNLQVAREVAATLSRPAPRALTGSSDAPLYRLNEAAITPASDACTSLGQIQCLTRQPE